MYTAQHHSISALLFISLYSALSTRHLEDDTTMCVIFIMKVLCYAPSILVVSLCLKSPPVYINFVEQRPLLKFLFYRLTETIPFIL